MVQLTLFRLIRDTRSGKVRSVIGSSYMLGSFLELWSKDLSAVVEELLTNASPANDDSVKRDIQSKK